MVENVKCGNEDCKTFNLPVPVTLYFVGRVASFDGLWPCCVCGETMKIASYATNNKPHVAKGKQFGKTVSLPRPSATKHRFGKKRPGLTIKVSGPTLGYGRKKTTTTKNASSRKRVSGKY